VSGSSPPVEWNLRRREIFFKDSRENFVLSSKFYDDLFQSSKIATK